MVRDTSDTFVVINGERYEVADISVDGPPEDEGDQPSLGMRVHRDQIEFETSIQFDVDSEAARKLSKILDAPVSVTEGRDDE